MAIFALPRRAFLVRERGGVMLWITLIPLAIIAAGAYLLRTPRE